MRKALVVVIAGASLLAACEKKPDDRPKAPAAPGSGPTAQAPAPAAPVAMPQRAPGLWEQKVTTAGMSQTTSICIDKTVEQRFSVWGQQAGKNDCTQSQVTPRIGGGWNFASTCNMGETGMTTTKGEVTGDFAKAYKVSAQNTIAGASTPQMNGTHQMTIEATWKGPCPAGVKPGDMLLPGGMKINMMQIPAG